jgi:hypothetical protein
MKIEFNWGTGIFTFIILFLMTMIGVIVFSFNQQVNLVTPEYYPKGVNYEDQITKVKNTALLKEKVSVSIEGKKIVLSFPDEFITKKLTGTVHFYYVVNFEKDKEFDLEVSEKGKQEFSIEGLVSGRYILKVDWEDGEKTYYQEIDLNI